MTETKWGHLAPRLSVHWIHNWHNKSIWLLFQKSLIDRRCHTNQNIIPQRNRIEFYQLKLIFLLFSIEWMPSAVWRWLVAWVFVEKEGNRTKKNNWKWLVDYWCVEVYSSPFVDNLRPMEICIDVTIRPMLIWTGHCEPCSPTASERRNTLTHTHAPRRFGWVNLFRVTCARLHMLSVYRLHLSGASTSRQTQHAHPAACVVWLISFASAY